MDEASIETRVKDLIERGLERYGCGDLDGAMSAWKHALALDDENQRAREYVAYVKRHFGIADEAPVSSRPASAEVELEIPFGLVTVDAESAFELDDYESFEMAQSSSSLVGGDDSGFAEQSTRVVLQAQPVDEGWSLDEVEVEVSNGRGFDDRVMVRLEAANGGANDATFDLDSDLAAVAEGLAALDDDDLAAPDTDAGLAAGESAPPTTSSPRAPGPTPPPETFLGYDSPRPPAEEHEPFVPGAALRALLEAEPRAPLAAADLDLGLGPGGSAGDPGSPSRVTTTKVDAIDLADRIEAGKSWELDPSLDLELGGTGEPAAGLFNRPLDPAPDPEAHLAAAVGDVRISFRDPGELADAGLESPVGIVEPQPPPDSADLEDQMAELERELSRESRGVEWTEHAGSRAGERPSIGAVDAGHADWPPLARRAPSVPPDASALAQSILEDVDRGAPPDESDDDRVRRRVAGLLDYAYEECQRDRLSVAAVAADLALAESPDSAVGQKLIHQQSELLVQVFRRYLGDLAGVPAVAMPMHELSRHELDHRTAFLLSRIDGTLSFEDILDVSGMPRLEAFRYLCRLRLQGILDVR